MKCNHFSAQRFPMASHSMQRILRPSLDLESPLGYHPLNLLGPLPPPPHHPFLQHSALVTLASLLPRPSLCLRAFAQAVLSARKALPSEIFIGPCSQTSFRCHDISKVFPTVPSPESPISYQLSFLHQFCVKWVVTGNIFYIPLFGSSVRAKRAGGFFV